MRLPWTVAIGHPGVRRCQAFPCCPGVCMWHNWAKQGEAGGKTVSLPGASVYWQGPALRACGASGSYLSVSYHYLFLLLSDESAARQGAGPPFNGLFQPWFARQKPLTNPFEDGSTDFMAPRARSPSFNKVKSKALSIRQWARGTLDAALFF